MGCSPASRSMSGLGTCGSSVSQVEPGTFRSGRSRSWRCLSISSPSLTEPASLDDISLGRDAQNIGARRLAGPSYAPIRPDPFSFRHRVSGASRLRRERDGLASSERVHRPLDRRASPPSSSLERDFCPRRLARRKGPEDDVSAQRPEIGDNHTREMAAKTAFLLASYQLRVSECTTGIEPVTQ